MHKNLHLNEQWGENKLSYQPDIHHCPYCGNSLKENNSFIAEYWSAEQNIFFCWCHQCGWRGEVIKIDQVIASEIDE